MKQPFEIRIDNIARRHPDAPAREIILTRLYYETFKAMNENQNRKLSEFGLNTTLWMALMLIYSTPGNAINPGELSSAMIASKTNVTRLSDELVKKGWVERVANSSDRRKLSLCLTAAGGELVQKILPTQMAFHRGLWQDFSATELEQFESVLRKILAKTALAEEK